MTKLKIFFVFSLVVSAFALTAFEPVKCRDRFVLPDGCCSYCNPGTLASCTACVTDNNGACSCK